MTTLPPEGISQDIWREALGVMGALDLYVSRDVADIMQERIARALIAAEEGERERCAKLAEKAFGGPAHTYASENADIYRAQDTACAHIAALIRKPQNDNFKSVPVLGDVS